MREIAAADRGRIVAVLGPTNTGKTHLAVERMLGHSSGIIGLPLRLLAREIYDKVVRLRGARAVALVTGEEKIVPPNPAYFVCTVEAMPIGRAFAFLAVDEIQLTADPERGHVFTDRLLNARGVEETMFLGADTIRPLISRLLPNAEIVTRRRFSTLSYAGPKKLSRLPRRSAVVAFSADGVYAIAELVRRQRGGAAVVLGALSPRTRNAQVALFQQGEVDFLVATDAIGMGLNMEIDHVAFASLRKFDGAQHRVLDAAEIGQVAGRAGRHMNDGTFGSTAEVGALEPELVDQVESHRFDPLKQIRWRNGDLDFSSVEGLLKCLDAPPPAPFLVRARQAIDHQSLASLAREASIVERAGGPAATRLLWDVCQIPDFRKTLHDQHIRLLRRVYQYLSGPGERLPDDWVARQIEPLGRSDGDIDTLASRIAHVRTWTYISHRADWLGDASHWQEKTRAIEDRLSDALHERLTQRFVDRRTSALIRGLKDRARASASINADGEILVEGHFVGRIHGLTFQPDSAHFGDGRVVRAAVNRVLGGAIVERGRRLARAADDEFTLTDDGDICWRDVPVARLAPGEDILRPRIKLLANDHLGGLGAERARGRLGAWLAQYLAEPLAPLHRLGSVDFSGPARGIAFQLVERLGVILRADVDRQLRSLDRKDFGRFKYNGVTLGREAVFLPALLKPRARRLRCLLWSVKNGQQPTAAPADGGQVSLELDTDIDNDLLLVAGFRAFGNRAVRVDMLERLAKEARRKARAGTLSADQTMMSLVGCGPEDIKAILHGIGYRAVEREGEEGVVFVQRRSRDAVKDRRKPRRRPRARSDSPFAALRDLSAR